MLFLPWCALLVELLPTAAVAQTPPGAQTPAAPERAGPPGLRARSSDFAAPSGTSLDELVSRMRESNLELQAAKRRLEQAEARLLQARLRPNPRAEYQDKSDRILTNTGHREEELTVSQPIELWGRRGRRIDLADVDIERVRYEIADLERLRGAELKFLAAQALAEVARLQALERGLGVHDRLRAATDVRVRAGDASQYDFAQVEAEEGRFEAESLLGAGRVETLLLQIKKLAGMPEDAPLVLKDSELQTPPPALPLAEALRLAAESRPDLKAAAIAERQAEARMRLDSANATPDVGAIVGFKRTATVDPSPVSSAWYFKIGLSVVLPVFNRNQGLIQEQIAARSEARLLRENLEQTIRRDVMIAYRRLEHAAADARLYQERLVPLGQRSVAMAKLGFEQGEVRLVDYLLEQRRSIDTESASAAARAELMSASVELERALGRRIGSEPR
jgi:cobalt-zinc-cadmium efflux system outer membrane protein